MRLASSVGVMLFGSGTMLLGIYRMWFTASFVEGVSLFALGLLVLDSGGRTLRDGARS